MVEFNSQEGSTTQDHETGTGTMRTIIKMLANREGRKAGATRKCGFWEQLDDMLG